MASTPNGLKLRKSYSILPPSRLDSPARSPTKSQTAASANGDRKFSESTGLAKFSLSPNRSPTRKPVASPQKTGLPVYIPVETTTTSSAASSKEELLKKYAAKQRQLLELQKQVDLVKHELVEIEIELEQFSPLQDTPSSTATASTHDSIATPETGISLQSLKNKASSIFTLPQTAQPPFQDYITKIQQTTEELRDILKNIVNDVGKNLDENNSKLKQFINTNNSKTANMFSDFLTNISPGKASSTPAKASTSHSPRDVLESSFMVDNLLFMAEEECSFSSNIIHIDELSDDE